jgi:hypothetical protein
MPALKGKKKRKPVRYRTVTLKLSARQKRSLDRFARSRRTTPNKLIKKAIRPLLENYADLEVRITSQKVNQLQLFGE